MAIKPNIATFARQAGSTLTPDEFLRAAQKHVEELSASDIDVDYVSLVTDALAGTSGLMYSECLRAKLGLAKHYYPFADAANDSVRDRVIAELKNDKEFIAAVQPRFVGVQVGLDVPRRGLDLAVSRRSVDLHVLRSQVDLRVVRNED